MTKEELEKENKELKTVKIPQLERRIARIRGAHSVDCRKLNARTEQVERLKKENAELQEQCSILADCNTCTSTCKTENVEMKKQLTKAKEIIKALLKHTYGQNLNKQNDFDLYLGRIKEAEQFLKEVSE